MKKIILLLFISIVLVLIQVSVLPEFLGILVVPNLIIAMSFALLIVGKYESAMTFGLTGGVLQDFLYEKPVGLSALVICLSLYLSVIIRKYLFKGRMSYILLIMASDLIYMNYVVFGGFIKSIEVLIGSIICAIIASLFVLIYRNTVVR